MLLKLLKLYNNQLYVDMYSHTLIYKIFNTYLIKKHIKMSIYRGLTRTLYLVVMLCYIPDFFSIFFYYIYI